MHKDPYKSDWENKIEAARERENELSSIESNYPPPINKRKVMSDTEILDEVLDMLVTNEDADWTWNDPVTEFRDLGRFIRDERAKRKEK